MARSAGITISAVVVFIGSGLTVLFGAIAGLSFFTVRSDLIPGGPVHLAYVGVFEALFTFTFGGWGIATGVGLIRTKEWARISIIIFAAFLTLVSLLPVLIFAILPVSQDGSLPPHFATILRWGVIGFYGLLAAVGIFWLCYFNTRRVKSQFQKQQALIDTPASYLPADIATPNFRVPDGARPLSISIIGWLLIVFSAFGPLSLLYSHAILPAMRFPLCFLGFFVFGRLAVLILLVWMALQAIAAIGLLKLKNWGRLAIIALQCFGFLNTLLLVAVPGNRARFQQIMDSTMASMNLPTPQPISFTFSVWFGSIVSLPIFLVILYFLITRKSAFVKSDSAPVQIP